jgi:TonB family protein
MKQNLQQHASTRRLLILMVVSLLLHGLLLVHWPTSKPLLEFDYQPQNLSLSLEPIEIVGQQQLAKKQVLVTKNTQPASKTRPVPNKPLPVPRSWPQEKSSQEKIVTREARQVDQQQTASRSTSSSMNRARIVSQIRHDLSQYFYYPPLARRKGLQGTVLLSFGISGQGAIHDIRIVKSSGYAILDLAAQDAMQRLDKLSWYAVLMHGKNMDLELPVIFRLTEG